MDKVKAEASQSKPKIHQGSDRPKRLTYWMELTIAVIGLIAIHAVLLSPTYHGNHIDPSTAGQFGDFVGGYVGQLISLTGLCFLIATFRTEYRRADRERFENKYFELLQLHRDNVEEMELKKSKGRKVFVVMLREWRVIANVARNLAQELKQDLTQHELIQISWYCLFYGVGANSSRMLFASLETFDNTFVLELSLRLGDSEFKETVRDQRHLGYLPFEGHQSRLGHYYRHLFQMVRYVENNTPRHVSTSEYMRTIRAQLSTHEQAFLLLNSLTPMGAAWWNRKLIDRFELVHNIPQKFFEPLLELDTRSIFEPGYFEKPEKHEREFKSLETQFQPGDHLGGYLWNDPIPRSTDEPTSLEITK